MYANLYRVCFADVPELEIVRQIPPNARSAWHLFILRLNRDKLSIDRDHFIHELHLRNIRTSVHFIPIQLHPFFASWANDPRNQCPRALAFYKRIVSLPLYPSMTSDELQAVVRAVKATVRQTGQCRYRWRALWGNRLQPTGFTNSHSARIKMRRNQQWGRQAEPVHPLLQFFGIQDAMRSVALARLTRNRRKHRSYGAGNPSTSSMLLGRIEGESRQTVLIRRLRPQYVLCAVMTLYPGPLPFVTSYPCGSAFLISEFMLSDYTAPAYPRRIED